MGISATKFWTFFSIELKELEEHTFEGINLKRKLRDQRKKFF